MRERGRSGLGGQSGLSGLLSGQGGASGLCVLSGFSGFCKSFRFTVSILSTKSTLKRRLLCLS